MLDSTQQARIGEAIRNAEAQTSAEMICVLAQKSSDYEFYPLLWAVFITFLTPWPLIWWGFAADRIFLVQFLAFILSLQIFTSKPVRFALVPLKLRRATAHRAALEQFVLRGVAKTNAHRGVLIFVSMAERWARIIVDDAIAEKIPAVQWQAAIDALLEANRQNKIGEGFIAAIAICGQQLAQHFPPEATAAQELPDRIYLI